MTFPKIGFRVAVLLAVLEMFPGVSWAQVSSVRGLIIEKAGASRVGNVAVTNHSQHLTTTSNELGLFVILAQAGDTLTFTKSGYTDFRQVLTSTEDLIVRLQPIIELGEVRVEGQSKAKELAEYRDQYRKQGSYYQGKPPVLAYFFQPLTALYELLGKTPGQARRFNEFYVREIAQTEIDRRFNASKVRELTSLDSIDLKNFMTLYRPDYDNLSKMDDYALINYIRKSLANFDASGRPKGLLSLPSLPKAKDLTERKLKY